MVTCCCTDCQAGLRTHTTRQAYYQRYKEKLRQAQADRRARLGRPHDSTCSCKACAIYRKTRQRWRKLATNWLRETWTTVTCAHCHQHHKPLIVFHHKVRLAKQFSPTAPGHKPEDVIRELQKCVPLCFHCHILLHEEEKQGGTTFAYLQNYQFPIPAAVAICPPPPRYFPKPKETTKSNEMGENPLVMGDQ